MSSMASGMMISALWNEVSKLRIWPTAMPCVKAA